MRNCCFTRFDPIITGRRVMDEPLHPCSVSLGMCESRDLLVGEDGWYRAQNLLQTTDDYQQLCSKKMRHLSYEL